MLDLLKKIHDKAEEYQGRRLLNLLLVVFLSFTLIGMGIGLLIALPRRNSRPVGNGSPTATTPPEEKSYEGRVVYVDPRFYPQDDISYYLEGSDGKMLYLLKADDEKLAVAEGHYVRIFGNITKTADGENEVLLAEKVVIINAPD